MKQQSRPHCRGTTAADALAEHSAWPGAHELTRLAGTQLAIAAVPIKPVAGRHDDVQACNLHQQLNQQPVACTLRHSARFDQAIKQAASSPTPAGNSAASTAG